MGTYNVHAGHCPQGQGASGAVGILQESVEDRIVKNEVIRLLRAEGNTVYDCTCDENTTKTGCLNKIIAKCNAHKVDGDYSIHLNSGRNDYHGDTKTGGVEVIIYDTGMREIAERIAKNIAEEFGYTLRSDSTSPCPGVKIDKGLRVLNSTKAPAALIECCFVDDADDAKVWDAKRCAKAIVEGILNKKISTTGGSGVNTVRRIKPGTAYLNEDCPIYDVTFKNVIINGKKGDHITVLDHGTEGVKVRHNSTVGYMHCKYVMPVIYPGEKLRIVEDVTITIKKGTQLISQDSGYMGNIVNGNFIINSKSVEKI
ncbi:N-acetylmuramoyl-L-alanine amidase [Faecalimonas sp. LCP19S3_D12]